MFQFKKILLPVDGSSHSGVAERNATSIAINMGAEIILLYVTDTIPAIIVGTPRDEAEKAQHEEADLILAPYRKSLGEHGIKFTERIIPNAAPGDTICKVALDEQCDIIVMGSRGLSDWEGVLVGSVTHRVLSRCHLPVLVTR